MDFRSMLGFAVAALGVSHREFWDMTPIEFNAASDCWVRMNISKEDREKIDSGILGDESPWADIDLVNRAKELMAQADREDA